MRPIHFDYSQQGGLNVARYEDDEDALEITWPGLMVDGSTYPPDKWWTYGAYGDANAVCIALAWRIARDRELFVIPSYYGERSAKLLSKTGVEVRWEYATDDTETGLVDVGFKRGRTCDYYNRKGRVAGMWKHALLLDIASWRELAKAQLGTRGDASGHLTMFALRPSRGEALADFLNTRSTPDLEAFLEPGERLVSVTVGEDLGYSHCVIVKSRDDAHAECERAAADLTAALSEYEDRAPTLKTIDEFIEAVDQFATDRT